MNQNDANENQPSLTEQWQKDNEDKLMDGTSSLKSYVRLSSNEDIEYGLQPHIGRCGGHMHFGGLLRVAFKPKPVTDSTQPLADVNGTADSKSRIEKLRAFIGPGQHWHSQSDSRLSRGIQLTVPVDPNAENAPQLLAAVFPKMLDKVMSELIPAPAAGWGESEVADAKALIQSLMVAVVNEGNLLRRISFEDRQWSDDPVGELPENVVAFLDAIEAHPNEEEGSESVNKAGKAE